MELEWATFGRRELLVEDEVGFFAETFGYVH